MRRNEFYKTEKKCKQCGKVFLPVKGYKFGSLCCNACKQKYGEDKINPYVLRKCKYCDNTFRVRKNNKLKVKCNSKECKDKNRLENERKTSGKQNISVHFEDNEFIKNKYKYSDKIIDYNMSPTKKAYIGLAKTPLQPNGNNIGFKGVKIQSENRELIQCFECGKWYKVISSRHVATHGLTIPEYKKKYGYNKNTALMSDTQIQYAAAKMVDTVNNSGKRMPQEKLNEFLKKSRGKGLRNTEEMKNIHGTCDAQLKFNLINYINRFHRIPSATTGKNGYSQITTLKNRFGNINNALKEYGLPTRKSLYKENLVEYKFEDNSTFYTKNGKGYEELYLIMKNKCPVLNSI